MATTPTAPDGSAREAGAYREQAGDSRRLSQGTEREEGAELERAEQFSSPDGTWLWPSVDVRPRSESVAIRQFLSAEVHGWSPVLLSNCRQEGRR
jgi:hypothetical protein